MGLTRTGLDGAIAYGYDRVRPSPWDPRSGTTCLDWRPGHALFFICAWMADDLWLYQGHPASTLRLDIKAEITCGNDATVETMEIAPEGDSHSSHRRLEIRRPCLLAVASAFSAADSHIPTSATTDSFSLKTTPNEGDHSSVDLSVLALASTLTLDCDHSHGAPHPNLNLTGRLRKGFTHYHD